MKRLGSMLLAIGAMGALAAPAFAGEDAGTVVSTAPPPVAESAGAPSTDSTGGQIQAWIHGNDDGSVDSGAGAEPLAPAPRRIHGEVSAGIGSNGYNSVSGVADIPIGQSSDLVVAASRDQFGGRGYRSTNQSVSVGLFLNGATAPRRCPASDDAYGGPDLAPYVAPAGAYGYGGACTAAANEGESPAY